MDLYEIRIKGHLDKRWARRFAGMALTALPNGETVLFGPVVDQAALYGILSQIRDLSMPLLLVQRKEPEVNDVS